MLRFFYDLWFEYSVKKLKQSFHIGYFSCKEKVEKTINQLKVQPGFCNHPTSCFQIQKFGIDFPADREKSGATLFVLSYEREDTNGDYWEILGVFLFEQEAKAKLNKYRRKYSVGSFDISTWKVDCSIEWREGFSSF